MRKEIISKEIKEKKCIAIIRDINSSHIINLAKALYAGGITLMEVTFNQKDGAGGYKNTLESISILREKMEGEIYVGAGTVMNKEQLLLAKEYGAEYIIAPNVNEILIKEAEDNGLAAIPGAFTPTEAVKAYEAGASFVKLFPAGDMGPAYVKAITAPLNHIPFLAVGNIDENNVCEFIQAGAVGVGIGGKLINKQWIKEGNFEAIERLAEKISNRII